MKDNDANCEQCGPGLRGRMAKIFGGVEHMGRFAKTYFENPSDNAEPPQSHRASARRAPTTWWPFGGVHTEDYDDAPPHTRRRQRSDDPFDAFEHPFDRPLGVFDMMRDIDSIFRRVGLADESFDAPSRRSRPRVGIQWDPSDDATSPAPSHAAPTSTTSSCASSGPVKPDVSADTGTTDVASTASSGRSPTHPAWSIRTAGDDNPRHSSFTSYSSSSSYRQGPDGDMARETTTTQRNAFGRIRRTVRREHDGQIEERVDEKQSDDDEWTTVTTVTDVAPTDVSSGPVDFTQRPSGPLAPPAFGHRDDDAWHDPFDDLFTSFGGRGFGFDSHGPHSPSAIDNTGARRAAQPPGPSGLGAWMSQTKKPVARASNASVVDGAVVEPPDTKNHEAIETSRIKKTIV